MIYVRISRVAFFLALSLLLNIHLLSAQQIYFPPTKGGLATTRS